MTTRATSTQRRSWSVAAGIAAAAIGLVACGSPGDSTGGGSAGALKGNCGAIPSAPPQDPDGVFKTLPKTVQDNYNGYAAPVHASPWASWKPPAGGAVVGISWNAPVNDYAADTLAGIRTALAKMPGVRKVVVLAGANQGDVTSQLQQYQSLVQQKVHLIIANTGVGGPFVAPVNAAAQAGIPTVSAFNTVPTKNAINILPNNYLAAAQTAAAAMKTIGGGGKVLQIHGIPGISIDGDAFRGFDTVLKRCPDVKVAGTLTAGFVPAKAKTQVLKFLSTHPGGVDAVLQAGGMTTGIISAFVSTGRRVPTVNDIAALKGSLGYWWTHRGAYEGTGSGGGAQAFSELTAGVVQRMLAGAGLKISDIVQPQPLIDDGNIGQWAQSGWDLRTAGTAPNPPGSYDYSAIFESAFGKAGT